MLVIGHKVEVYAPVFAYIDGICNVKPVELNGIATYGTTELVAQQQDIVVIDIHIGEDIAHQCRYDATRLEQVVDTG